MIRYSAKKKMSGHEHMLDIANRAKKYGPWKQDQLEATIYVWLCRDGRGPATVSSISRGTGIPVTRCEWLLNQMFLAGLVSRRSP